MEKRERTLKISNMPANGDYVPGFKIAGKYMQKLGYKAGDFVGVMAKKDAIIILRKDATDLNGLIEKNPSLLNLINAFDCVTL